MAATSSNFFMKCVSNDDSPELEVGKVYLIQDESYSNKTEWYYYDIAELRLNGYDKSYGSWNFVHPSLDERKAAEDAMKKT